MSTISAELLSTLDRLCARGLERQKNFPVFHRPISVQTDSLSQCAFAAFPSRHCKYRRESAPANKDEREMQRLRVIELDCVFTCANAHGPKNEICTKDFHWSSVHSGAPARAMDVSEQ